MSDEIMLVFGEDGVAREYDDTWDITIHCESEEEQKAVLEKLNNSNQEAKHSTESSLTQKALDTISRQAAVDYCYALINAENPSDPSDEWNYSQERINQTEVILHHLEFMPSAQQEPQWIPVSERLPGENEFVLVTFGWFGRKTDPGVNIDEIRDGDWMISEVVTAWMPLPEPYRAERRTDGN